ncbi:Beta-barrel assembly machine subunit BamD [Salinimicrobium catena]|uniref:Beta-barrel assembly machine subunit BamD n=1 Tax=Salinimicrobium catena TaxID=390640 RepID=A0A1H5L0L2_9FLAO|nr:outer membrane protein assembly factor BamD [Salinimicrobium catena]SDL04272.1 Beta-barrel assembly machine subunit BamD [Salinimicrobium catena]SEE70632.1 Beta-barrel assembly machine subunit BamD [Salinimicrobium catena]
MKKIILLLSIVLVATSCSQYQKVLKSDDTGLKYSTAEELYNEAKAGEGNTSRKFKKALRIFEQIVPEYRGKPQAQKLMFMYADTYYELGDHYLAGYQFERFVETYPQSEKLEEAAFKGAKSYYFLSPRYDLDQTETHKAIEKLQAFINRFPESEKLEEANELVTELRVKLEKKSYEIAKQYHHTRNYKAAITALNNFILEYPGSPFREQAYYYKFDSAYQYAINSYAYAMPERLKEARKYYQDYLRYYPEGKFVSEAEAAFTDITEKEQNYNQEK